MQAGVDSIRVVMLMLSTATTPVLQQTKGHYRSDSLSSKRFTFTLSCVDARLSFSLQAEGGERPAGHDLRPRR